MGCHKECYRSRRRAKDVVFPATRELWRFLVSTTLYPIWIERLRRLEDATLFPEVHIARAKTQFRRAVTRFRNSTYQPDMGEDGLLFARVRSALADTLLCSSDSHPFRALPLDNLSGFFICFLRRRITKKSWTGRSRIRHCPTLHSSARCMRPVGFEHVLQFCKHHQQCR